MSEQTFNIQLKINFPVILLTVMVLHAMGLAYENGLNLSQTIAQGKPLDRQAIKLKDISTIKDFSKIRTVGARDSNIKNSTYLSKNPSKVKTISKDKYAPDQVKSQSHASNQPAKQHLSLKDLSAARPTFSQPKAQTAAAPAMMKRPGTRPEVLPQRPKAINAISLKGSQIQQFAQGGSPSSNAVALSGDPRSASLANSDILVNLEVPEGVNPDELNKYELMFYGFQKRTATGYVNSFYKHLDKFQSENPHLHFPMTDTQQVMTGRLTYDSQGNIKQIKMIRWSNVDRLQGFFMQVLKDMDTLHNPPQALWEKTGEFSVFFSLVVNG